MDVLIVTHDRTVAAVDIARALHDARYPVRDVVVRYGTGPDSRWNKQEGL